MKLYHWYIKKNSRHKTTSINTVTLLAKGKSLKVVLDKRLLNSRIDESKCIWPIEPIQVKLTNTNEKHSTTADMNSANNQMPQDENSRRLTQFVMVTNNKNLI